MSGNFDRLVRVFSAALPVTIVTGALTYLLPVDTLTLILVVLTAWTCASVPIGVLVGHCALGEE